MRGVAVPIFLVLIVGSGWLSTAQILLNEVSLDEKRVELLNPGSTSQDVANWWLCNSSLCRQIGTITISQGSSNIDPNSFAVIDFPDMESNGEAVLFSGPNFSDPNAMADYLQYGNGPNPRETLAVQAGLWIGGESVPRPAFGWTLSRFSSTPGADGWGKGLPTLGYGNESPVQDMQLSEVETEHGYVELLNTGTDDVDVSPWWICNDSTCARIRDIGRLTNSMIVAPGRYFVAIFNELGTQTDEVAIYEGDEGNSPGAIVDYVAFGRGGQPNEEVAVDSGLWITGEFGEPPPSGRSLSRFSDEVGASAWDIGLPSLGVPNRRPTPVPVGNCGPATASKQLNANNVRTTIFNNGGLFGTGTLPPPYFEVPAGSGLQSISIGGIWVGGRIDGATRAAATDFGPWEFFPGPLDGSGEPPADCSDYDRLFKVSAEDIRQYEATGTLSEDLADWPYDLGAPVLDQDGNPNNYNLALGDRPGLKGDETIWWIMNDAGNQHEWSGSLPIGLEVRGTAYASPSEQSAVNNSVLINYVLEHKGGGGVFNTYLGIWLNVDLGDPSDDYVGFDSVNGIAFAWNGDDFDGGAFGYGDRPSALGVVALEGVNVADDGVDNDRDGEVDENDETVGLTRFVSYRDDDSPFGNPTNGQEAYQYLSGNWRNGSPIIFGGDGTGTDQKDGLTTTHIYTGIPPNFWSEENIDGAGTRNEPGERRFIASLGPFSLHAGQTRSVTFAIVWAQGNDRFDSIASLRTSVTGLRQIFDEGFPTTSTTSDELTSPTRFDVVENFPNPFAVTTNIRFTIKGRAAVRLVIVDPLGRTVREESLGMLDAGLHSHTVLREGLPSGIYFYQLATESESRTGSMAVVK